MTAPRFPGNDDFAHIVRHAPLISINVVIKDPKQNVLLGLRVDEPAKGQYFVPGGVILKNETIRAAFARVLLTSS
jgi:colanic acid biosynthesis protein WcaH